MTIPKQSDIWGETYRLFLQKMSFDDFKEIADIMRGNNVQKIWEHYFSDNDVNKWIEKCSDFYKQHNLGYFLAVEKSSNTVIGQIALMPDVINGATRYEIGYILKEQYEHKGYATEGAKYMAQYAFEKLKLGEVIFEIRPVNTPSINVAKRLGAIQNGSFVKNVHGKEMEHFIFVLRNI